MSKPKSIKIKLFVNEQEIEVKLTELNFVGAGVVELGVVIPSFVINDLNSANISIKLSKPSIEHFKFLFKPKDFDAFLDSVKGGWLEDSWVETEKDD